MKNQARVFFFCLIGGISFFAKASEEPQPIVLQEQKDLKREELKTFSKNIARWHMGAKLFRVDSNNTTTAIPKGNPGEFPEGNLLGEDEALPLELKQGTSRYLIDLNNPYKTNRFFFKSFNAKGQVKISVANQNPLESDNPESLTITEASFAPKTFINMKFPTTDTRFVLVEFEMSQTGSISNFGLMGEVNIGETNFMIEDYDPDMEPGPNDKMVDYDFASLYTGAEVTYLSGGAGNAQVMIDDDIDTSYEFGDDSSNAAAVIDLGMTARVERVSLLMDAPPGALNVYHFETLPNNMGEEPAAEEATAFNLMRTADQIRFYANEGGGSGSFELSADFFANNKPDGSFNFDGSGSNAFVNMSNVKMRFILLQWAGTGTGPLTIFEVSVIGKVPEELSELGYLPQYEFFDGVTGLLEAPDAATAPEELPSVSPTPDSQ